MQQQGVFRDEFPFLTIKMISALWTLFGAALLGLGIGDVAHTAKHYGDDAECAITYPTLTLPGLDWESPCDNKILNYAYAGAPIWTSVMVAIVAYLGWTFDPDDSTYATETRRKRFLYASMFTGLVLLPVTLALAIVEFVEGYKVFYGSVGGVDVTLDDVKYAVPMTVIVVSAVAIILALASIYLAYSHPLMNYDEIIRDRDYKFDYGRDDGVYGRPMSMPTQGMNPYGGATGMNPYGGATMPQRGPQPVMYPSGGGGVTPFVLAPPHVTADLAATVLPKQMYGTYGGHPAVNGTTGAAANPYYTAGTAGAVNPYYSADTARAANPYYSSVNPYRY